MTRKFPDSKLNSQRRSRRFTQFLAAFVVSSSCGLSASPEALAQSHNHSREIRQVAGERSGGFFSGLFGRGSGDSGQSDEPYRKATPVPSERDVNWNGIPYHNPHDGRAQTTQRAPIHDPGIRSRSAEPTRPPQPLSNPSPGSQSAAPTPPPIAASTPRKLTPAVDSGVSAQISSSGRPSPLSVTQSSRRPPSLQPKPQPATAHLESTRPEPLSNPNSASMAVNVKPVELVPKVSRRVIKSVPPATVATKGDSPAEQSVARSLSADSQDSDAMTEELPQEAETTPTTVPHVARREIRSTEPTPLEQDVASEQVQPEPLEVAATNPTATLGVPTLAPPAGDAEANATKFARLSTSGDNQSIDQESGTLAAASDAAVALHPLSDRLPIDDTNDSSGSALPTHDAQLAAQGDSFAPRAQTAAGATTPQYHRGGFGHNEIASLPPASETAQTHSDAASGDGMSSNANAMRTTDTSASVTGSGVPASAINVAANSNTSATELPGIRVITAGPRQVMIRQTHTYEIRVENRGSITAQGLVIRAHIPDWADVVSQQASRGDVAAATEDQVRNLNWRIDRLDAGQSETLNVRLKAARSGTHDLDVDWTLAPQKRSVQVTVQEPELALTIDGPDEVVFGESKTYQIRVLNSGDGIAPEVVFTLSPDSSSPQSQRIGDIPAGKEAQFEVELTAQDLGELKIHGIAVGDLELKAEADKTVRVLAAKLEAVLTGPEVKYQDTEATYQLELTNEGSAASENVVATLQLPMGVTYQGGLEGATIVDSQLRWKIASMPSGAVRKYQFQCSMNATGQHQFSFECKGSAAGQTSVSLDTTVEAIADLVLSIVDPTAPAPVGEDVSYEIVIRNRGSKPALDVQAIAQFSTGIEPKQITGHAGKVVTGQVLVEPIARIEGGQEVRMTIVARAESGGHHRFRTEVRSGDTVLVAEEATHFLAPKTQRITRRSASHEEPVPPVR